VAQLSDLMFTTRGPSPGAILLEWHVQGAQKGDSGIWDVHYRIGGADGTLTGQDTCPTSAEKSTSPRCIGTHTLLAIKPAASVYIENMWGWTADHDIDTGAQLNIFNARGLVIETNQPVWLYGTSMEHSYLFQYAIAPGSSNVLLSILQSETPYYQPQFPLVATAPTDPAFYSGQMHAFALAATGGSSNVVLYGTGFYSFFTSWQQNCGGSKQPSCQRHISRFHAASSVRLHNFNTHASDVVLAINGVNIWANETENGFCSTVSWWS